LTRFRFRRIWGSGRCQPVAERGLSFTPTDDGDDPYAA
jgi:hypothetical protein